MRLLVLYSVFRQAAIKQESEVTGTNLVRPCFFCLVKILLVLRMYALTIEVTAGDRDTGNGFMSV